MPSKCPFRSLVSAVLLVVLGECQTSTDHTGSNFFVASTGHAGGSGDLPTSHGWQPNSQLETSVWHEPTGPGSVSSEWKKVST